MKKFFKVFLLVFIFFITINFSVYGGERAGDFAQSLKDRGISPLLITGLISLLPIFELRGGIPVGIAMLDQGIFSVYVISVFFNLLPILPLLLLLSPLKRFLEGAGLFLRFFRFLTKRAERNKRLMERYEEFGLMIFVAIPLPMTGAWTGALISVILGLRIAKSFLFITFGVLLAGVIVTLLTILGITGILIASFVMLGFIILYVWNIIRERRKNV